MENHKYTSVDKYFEHVPAVHIEQLNTLRSIIKLAFPEAEEVISYNMPAYRLGGILVYFALFPKHIGFYPTPSAISAFEQQLGDFKYAKGSIQFSFDKKLPKKLIKDICHFRLKELRDTSKKAGA